MQNWIAKFLKYLINTFTSFKHFFPGLLFILRVILRLFRRTPPRRAHRDRCCIDVPPDVYKRADPLIYAQYYLMKMGLSVTWDNPDIHLFDGGNPVPSGILLKADHEYEVEVRVWNGSYDAPAAGVGVHLSYLSFGVGTTSHPIESTFIELGVKGSSHCPAFAHFKWQTPATTGHYCLQALLTWADDANPANNLGQKNVNVAAAHSPAHFSFMLRNEASVTRRFVFDVDTYQPAQTSCEDWPSAPERGGRLAESRARWAHALETQGYDKFPVPEDWTVTIDPAEPELEPGDELLIKVAIEPQKTGFSGAYPFNVHTFAIDESGNRHLVGGVTLNVTSA